MKAISHLRQENGFTLMELLVASVVTIIVLGSSVALTSQIQNGYRRQLEDSAGEQEARYAMEWIGRYLRSAGNNPFSVTMSQCPGANTPFFGLIVHPGDNSAITLQSDSNPPDGLIGGESPGCDQINEHVTISFDADTSTIIFQDDAVGEDATTRTDSVIGDMQFAYLDSSRNPMALPGAGAPTATVTAFQANIFYVQIRITIRTRTIQAGTGLPNTRVLTREVRVRNR